MACAQVSHRAFNIKALLLGCGRGYPKVVFTTVVFALCLTRRIDQPSPGEPFHGGVFEAFLPDSEKTRKLMPRLKEAFRQGLTFTVTGTDTGARVSWDCIPHKTTLYGGKSGWVRPVWMSDTAVGLKVTLVHVSTLNGLLFVSLRNGYPDSTYLTHLSEVLTAKGIGEPPAKS